MGQRQGRPYAIKDNADILAIMQTAWQRATGMNRLAATLLADARLWGEDPTLTLE